MSAKYTPGPWKDGPVFMTGRRAIFFNDDSKPGKWQRRLDRDKDGTFSEEDARLLAVAPELLEALQEVTPSMPPADAPCHVGIVSQGQCAHCQRIARAHAAIAKATGSAA